MKTKEIATENKTATKKATVKVLTAKEKAERLAKFQASEYNQRVNVTHKETKEYSKTLKGVRNALLNAKQDANTGLTANFVKILQKSKKSDVVWKHMTANVRAYNSGSYGTHTMLQYLRKFETELLEMK